MSNGRKERAALRNIVKLVRRFDRKCARAEYTDVGEVWEVFEDIEDFATAALPPERRKRA